MRFLIARHLRCASIINGGGGRQGELVMSLHRQPTATRSFPLSPDLYGFYRPSKPRRWPRFAVLGGGGLCVFALLGGVLLANAPAKSVFARNTVEPAPAGTLPVGGGNKADRAAPNSVQTTSASANARIEQAEPAPAPTKLDAKRPVNKHAQPVHRYAAKKPYHRQAQGSWRNDRYSWGRYNGNPNGGGWSFN